MSRVIHGFAVAMGLVGVVVFVATCSKDAGGKTEMNQAEMVKRGEYLVNLGGCNDCHTPKRMTAQGPVPDPTILLSGHPSHEQLAPIPEGIPNMGGWAAACNANMTAWAGPWGVSFAANLTPDKQTGLGDWAVEDFIGAMRTGNHMGNPNGANILPPMPWQSIGQLTDDDLKAIFAYLQTLTPVPNLVPGNMPPGMPEGATN